MHATRFLRAWSFTIALAIVVTEGTGVAKADASRWKEQPVLETTGWLPGAAAYSPDGTVLVLGGAAGEVVALDAVTRNEKWKASVGGGFASVAFSADGKSILATCQDGVQFLDAVTGERGIRFEEKESRPIAIGVFPEREIGAEGTTKYIDHKIIFGNARRYFVKQWIKPEGAGTIQLSNVAEGKQPADPDAVPLAVDPHGRSVILTGPLNRDTGKNVLWAWVAGNHEEGSPGNRLLEGHQAPVVSAAWSRDGKTAVTGDAMGRVILWDAVTMTEASRREFGHRLAALALSADGKQVAAVTVGKEAKYYTWEAVDGQSELPLLATDSLDYSGPIRACVAFSPNNRQIVASAIDLRWLARSGRLVGKLHVWEAEPAR